MEGIILSNGDVPTPFEISNAVKQGACLLQSSLTRSSCASENMLCAFGTILCATLREGVPYRLDVSLIGLRRLNDSTKTRERLLFEACLWKIVPSWHTQADLQAIVIVFAEVC